VLFSIGLAIVSATNLFSHSRLEPGFLLTLLPLLPLPKQKLVNLAHFAGF